MTLRQNATEAFAYLTCALNRRDVYGITHFAVSICQKWHFCFLCSFTYIIISKKFYFDANKSKSL